MEALRSLLDDDDPVVGLPFFAQVNVFAKSKPHSKILKKMMERIRMGYKH